MCRCSDEDSRSEGCRNQNFSARDVTAQTFIMRDELAKLQQEDTTLVKYVDLKDAVKKRRVQNKV